jgi:MFS family permease
VKPQKQLSRDWVRQELKNSHAWWIGGAFTSFTFAFFAFNTWIAAYLVQSDVLPLVQASWIPAIVAFFTAASNMGSGWLLAKFGNRLVIFLLPTLIMTLIWPLFLEHHLALLYASAIVLGAVSGFVPTFVFAAGPLYATRKETIGIVMSIVILGENAGILIGPEVFGLLRDLTGQFTASFWIMSAASLFSIAASIRIWRTGVFSPGRSRETSMEA